MTRSKRPHISVELFLRAAVACLVFVVAARTGIGQQNPPQLQITSPTDGSVVNPGQSISVTFTSPANAAFTQVGVAGEDPIGLSNTATSVPAQLTLSIPADIANGTYMLTAFGTTTSGQNTPNL